MINTTVSKAALSEDQLRAVRLQNSFDDPSDDQIIPVDDDEEQQIPEQPTTPAESELPAPAAQPQQPATLTRQRTRAEILEALTVEEAFKVLNDTVRRKSQEILVKITVSIPAATGGIRQVSYVVMPPLVSCGESTAVLFLRRGTYSQFSHQDEITMEFRGKVLDVMYVGTADSLSNFDYDLVCFVIRAVRPPA
jgi:hypothetical protein